MNGYIKLHQALYREPKLTAQERAARAKARRDRAIFSAGLRVTLRSGQIRENGLQVRYLFDAAQYHTERSLLLRQRVSFIPGFEVIPISGGEAVYAVGYETAAGVTVPWGPGQNVISRLLKAGLDPRKKTFVHLPPVEGEDPAAAEALLTALGAFLCRGSVFCLSARGYGAEKRLRDLGDRAGLRLLEQAGAAELERDFVGPFNRNFLHPMMTTPVDLNCCYFVKK